MQMCLNQDQKGFGHVSPNPMVGCVIVHNNQVVSASYHKIYGGPHAEVNAIEQALQKTTDLSQSTLYVSLEPCSHFGKTPPCSNLIIQHKIKKVVIASLDPNPKVSSVEKLKAAGIEVEVMNEPSAIILNKRFFTQHNQHRPNFILKRTIECFSGLKPVPNKLGMNRQAF